MFKLNRLKLILVAILLFAFALRVYGINWDQGQHLHPDERFLTMVAVASKLPSSVGQYLDPQVSPLNPANVGFSFFVYGTFPLVFAKIVAVFFGFDSYERFTILGRLLSAIADVFTVLFVFKITALLEGEYKFHTLVKYFAALMYSLFVLPIQLSHFFTVDPFVTLFLTSALFFSLQYFYKKTIVNVLILGVYVGLAIACKGSALYSVPLYVALLCLSRPFSFKKTCMSLFVFGFISYVVLRMGSPYMFKSSSFLDPSPSPLFVANVKQLKSFDDPKSFFPPGIQWISKQPVIFASTNIIFFGIGIPAFIFFMWGGKQLYKKRKLESLLIAGWMGVFFIYQSSQFVKSIRYFYVLYPLIAIVCGVGFLNIWQRASKPVYKIMLLCFIFIWPAAFIQIYTRPHSRVSASRWIYEHIPAKSYLAEEHWDDSLPLLFPEKPIDNYEVKQLPVFDPDTIERWSIINTELSKADYIIFSSNRGYGSIGTVPEKYPRMSKFYKELFAGSLPFKKVKEFTSYPIIPDQWSDEAFTVYDHPKVTIFKRTSK